MAETRGIRAVSASRNFPRGGWEASYRTPNGKERTQRFSRKVDAEAWLLRQRADMTRGLHVDPLAGRVTFEEYADTWAAGQDWKATSRESWTNIRKRLVKVLGGWPLASIDRDTLQAAQQELSTSYSRSTVEVTMSYARSILRAAHANGRIGRDPTFGLRPPKARADDANGKVGPDDVPTRVEALAILEGAPARFRAAIALGLAGLRIGEVLGMSADRIELDKRTVTIDRQLQRIGNELTLTTPKSEKKRTIVVPMLVAVELRRHLRDHVREDGMLFGGTRGALMRRDAFYDSAWKPALKGAKLVEDRFVFHSLRHSCASTLLAEGAPLTAVAGHLGDAVDTVSRTYVHWLRDDRDVPAEVLDRMLAPVSAAAAR